MPIPVIIEETETIPETDDFSLDFRKRDAAHFRTLPGMQ